MAEALVQQQEQVRTPEKSPEEIYREAMEQKRDTLIAFHAMNLFRKGKVPAEMPPEEVERYKSLRDEWQAKKVASLSSWEFLPEDKQDELAAMGTNLNVVEANLALLGARPQREAAGAGSQTTAETVAPGVSTQESQPTPTQTIENRPESGLTLTDLDNYIAQMERSATPPLLMIEAYKAKRAELAQRQEAEANPTRTAPQGFLARAKAAFDRARGVGPLEQSIGAQPETSTPQPEIGPEKPRVWSWKFWKERGKGLLTFGLYDIHQAEKFRTKTGEVAGETKNLATLLQQERNLSPEEAEKEAWEMVDTLNREGLSISAPEFYQVSEEITERKRKENDEEISYIVRTAENAIYDNLQKQKGEAGQQLVTRENQLAIRPNLIAELNKLRDGAARNDFKNFAKVIRRNLDEHWKWRYAWGGLEALTGIMGTWFLVTKFSALEAAKAAAGSPEAAKEFVTKTMDQNVWNTLDQLAKNNGIDLNPAELKSLAQRTLDYNGLQEPEWVNRIVDGLRSSRTLPQGFPLNLPSDVTPFLGFK